MSRLERTSFPVYLAAEPARAMPRLADLVELTKPRLTLLAVLTTLAGVLIGLPGAADVWLLAHTLFGTALVGAGVAALNQYLERDADARMPRTANRPLPAGRMLPAQAMFLGAALTSSGLAELLLAVNALSASIAALVVVSYLFCYTPLKRVSPHCTIVGAVPGALPPVIGYAAAAGRIDATAMALFFVLFTWQLPHFFAIAVLYRDDYAAANMPMLPVVDPTGRRTRRAIALWTAALVVASIVPFFIGAAAGAYLVAALVIGAAFAAFAFAAVVNLNRLNARRVFLASIIYLPLLLTLMAAGRLTN
jgi:protoheme IX farnesyltransferase